jgi:phospholipid/cholesterol/gamma-HCH transport system substrate-binding protein
MERRRANQLIAVGMIAGLLAAGWFAFKPGVPFSGPYELRALVASSNQLRGGAPVRIAGVNVGKVTEVSAGPAETTQLTMEIDEAARPLRTDATIRIRPRVFLEGGFYVELSPGTPAAPELGDGGTLPLSQSARPVQFHQLLSVFEQPIRESLAGGLDTLAQGFAGGGAQGLRAVAPNLAPALRDIAIVADAAQGSEPHDVSRLIAGAGRVTAALARDRRALAGLVTNLRVTADALSADDSALADTITEVDLLLRAAPSGLRALDGALPVLERVSRAAAPAVRVAPRQLRRTGRVLAELGGLVQPGVRERTIAGLRTTFLDLPTLVVRMGGLFPTVKPLADCLRTHIVPTLLAQVDDGALSTGRPVWQDFAHALVGLSSASQNFDANGYAIRYEFGGGGETFSTDPLPGLGTLTGQGSGPLRSRPIRPADGNPPPIRRDVACSTQAVPALDAEAGPG